MRLVSTRSPRRLVSRLRGEGIKDARINNFPIWEIEYCLLHPGGVAECSRGWSAAKPAVSLMIAGATPEGNAVNYSVAARSGLYKEWRI